jgi:uncharacterized protein (TIGR02145 family)
MYREVYMPKPVTNENGLLTVEIGGGVPIPASRTLSSLNWSGGPYFIKTEIDPTGNAQYSISSTSQFLSVPYAFYAKTAESVVGGAATRWEVQALLARIEAMENHLNLSPATFADTRDGIKYKMVKIGDQVWMAENLKYLPEITGVTDKVSETTPGYYVLNYHGSSVAEAKATQNYNTFGVLYNWPAAMAGASESNSIPSGVQGVCPPGWHLPSMNEWKQLVDYLGGEKVAALKLMATGSSPWDGANAGSTNESGFTALPGGAFINAWGIGFITGDAAWWTSTSPYPGNENGNSTFYFTPFISSYDATFYFNMLYDLDTPKGSGFSVRCVKN